ncbi:SDR family oxidoreductase [Halodesulfovibrio marinisediminis]|uniref:NADP-dependent 3-hydroxy acid dehydrogenase YdfG n=1 Tax=Halodesulfovibrio marinisediminis DSM 17456 TaxID=1121457 RepID=A0A1N6DJV2_9BACT|nr:SDR family oxidoreductase [Halodesulfovibrio marinisediminis]SIN70997.1 NADP-dependent 3-hydroxy acid dehydrogenase YdfG [Halodesulfovibrio marinisediminis DSM 17456]
MSKPLIVITGASSGFGEATARTLSEKGFPLLLIARRLDRLKALHLPNTICAKVDVTDRKAMVRAIADAEATFGPVDCMINNAGVMLLGQACEQDPAEWQKMIDVNVVGLLNGIHAVLPSMRERKQGTIINVSSVAGRKTFPNHAVYCGTKFAVHAMSENIREEVAADNVRVIVIAPGAAETELLSHTTSDEIKANYNQWKEQMGGVMSAQDVANSIVFAYEQPQSVCVREIVLAPTLQEP